MIIVQKTLNKIILGKQIAILDNPLIFLSIIVIIPINYLQPYIFTT
jgi:hypothetical protein